MMVALYALLRTVCLRISQYTFKKKSYLSYDNPRSQTSF